MQTPKERQSQIIDDRVSIVMITRNRGQQIQTALEETWRLIKESLRNKHYRAGLADAVLDLSWVLAARDPVPIEIDRQVKIAERQFYDFLASST